MDDSSLKTLLLRSKQSGHVIPFTPGFNKKVFKYHCVVESEDEIRPEASEADAFAQVLKSNSESGVTLKFGENTVDIKVDAADKSHSIYSIVVIRPNGLLQKC
ncbi:hypothetical protein HK098_006340 [Nowakowskiella sp. JEL0407]|nr:hypothetical protein HK098_006340 [Nowakowskiella sp. JEL0407]